MIVLKIAKSLWPEGVGHSIFGKSYHSLLYEAHICCVHTTDSDLESIPKEMTKAEFLADPYAPPRLNAPRSEEKF